MLLNQSYRSAVPQRDRLVRGGSQHNIRKVQELGRVDRVSVAAQSVPTPQTVQVPNLGRLVARRRHEEIPARVKVDTPHGLRVLAERVHTLLLLKTPYLDGRVAAARCEHFPATRKRTRN